MAQNKYVLLDSNLLLEYVYTDSDALISENQVVITHKKTGFNSFTNTDVSNTLPSETYNILSRQLTPYNILSEQWIKVEDNSPHLEIRNYPTPVPIKYDIIKIHLPINYTFDDVNGLAFKLSLDSYDNTSSVYLTHWYYDKLIHSNPLLETPFLMNEKYWGKYFLLKIPSASVLSAQRNINGNSSTVIPGTLNSYLHSSGISQTAPLLIETAWIRNRRTIGTQIVYDLGVIKPTVIGQDAPYMDLSIKLEESTEGSWFNIYGAYEGTLGGFSTFIEKLKTLGQVNTITYEIRLYQQNTLTSIEKRDLDTDISTVIEYRPIIKNATTTVMIEAIMRLKNEVDGSIIERKGSLALLEPQISKYGKDLIRIDVSGVMQPKVISRITNEESSGNIVSDLKLDAGKQLIPVLIDRNNIVLKDKEAQLGNQTFYPQGGLEIIIYPFENVFKLTIAKNVNTSAIEYFSVPSDSNPKMIFKSNSLLVELPLWTDSGEVDLTNGSLVFMLTPDNTAKVANIYYEGFANFYIVLDTTTDDSIRRSVLYSGKFILYESSDFRNRT